MKIKNKMRHTKTPWRMEKHDDHLIGTPEKFIGEISDSMNAAFIVKAVNAHDSLIEAIREGIESCEDCNDDGFTRHPFAVQKMKDALKLAAGE